MASAFAESSSKKSGVSTTKRKVRPLDPELLAVAFAECNENSINISENVVALQTWIRQCPHLKARTDDQLLVAFLRRCKYSMEEAKRRIDGFYAIRHDFPEVLRERQLNDSFWTLFRSGVHIIPSRPMSATGPRIVISQFCKYDRQQFHPRDAMKLLFMLLEVLALDDDHASVAGVEYVIDGRDVSTEQMFQFDPLLLKRCWILHQHGLPIRFTAVHFINVRRDTQAVFKLVTHFLPVQMPFKFIMHSKAEDLFEHIPRELMTVEYGGNNGYHREALADWEARLKKEYTTYFANDGAYGTNEKLRVGQANSWQRNELGALNGMDGSFRRLQID